MPRGRPVLLDRPDGDDLAVGHVRSGFGRIPRARYEALDVCKCLHIDASSEGHLGRFAIWKDVHRALISDGAGAGPEPKPYSRSRGGSWNLLNGLSPGCVA